MLSTHGAAAGPQREDISLPSPRHQTISKRLDAIDRAVGHNIRFRRLAHGMAQAELGRRLGLSFQQVQKYEKGINRVGSGRLLRIARIFEVPIASFYEGAEGRKLRTPGTAPDSPPVPSALALIADREPFRLVQAFAKVRDRGMRRAIVVLVEKAAARGG